MRQIPFNRIHISGLEQKYMADAIREGHIAGNGRYTQRVEGFLQKVCNSPRVLLTGSCSHALEMCALLLNISAGDEVIVPSFTFPSTVGSFVLRGARPVFVDVRPDTLNLDEQLIEEKITPRTRAIVVAHYAGVACEMDAIEAIAQRHGVAVVEDNAQGLFGKYRGRPLGSVGALGAVSFHETKNFTCGEGGALIIGGNQAELIERAEVLREMGTDRSRFLKGAVDKYTWVDLGSSYLLSEILAAFLAAQLEAREEITRRRRKIWERYWLELSPLYSSAGILLPSVPDYCEQPYHMFYMLMPSPSERELLLRELNNNGIQAQSHYEPLHLSRMGASFGYTTGDLPVTESVSSQLLRLPFYPDLSEDEQLQVIEQVMAAQLR